MADTSKEYNEVIDTCRSLFQKKMKDYGSAWRILRLPSLTDQIFIKAQRIRGLQQNKQQRVDEGQVSEFIGIINYCIMALVQLEKGVVEQPDIVLEEALELYDQKIAATKQQPAKYEPKIDVYIGQEKLEKIAGEAATVRLGSMARDGLYGTG